MPNAHYKVLQELPDRQSGLDLEHLHPKVRPQGSELKQVEAKKLNLTNLNGLLRVLTLTILPSAFSLLHAEALSTPSLHLRLQLAHKMTYK